MTQRLLRLAQEITREIEQIEQSVRRACEGWRRFQQDADELYLDSVALGLHNFYSGLERLFEKVARVIDGKIPQGANWHQLLLEQMSLEVAGKRPAMISQRNREALEEYRGLRHIVRNVYAFQLEAAKLKPLVEEAPTVLAQIKSECLAFAAFIEQGAN